MSAPQQQQQQPASAAEELLQDTFHAAADHLGQLVTANPTSVHDSVKLQLYGLYKQATAGRCAASKPPFWQRAARLKWNHWNKLGDMPAAVAMQQYIETLSNVDPAWQQQQAGQSSSRSSGGAMRQRQGGAGGPVFSRMRGDPAAEQQQQSSSHGGGGVSIQEAAGQGDLETLKALLAANKSALNSRDESGCSALHFAADRGQAAVVQLLVEAGANLNAADADGQTALHYGAMCGHEEVCGMLLKAGADSGLCDADGNTAAQVAPKGWTCWDQ